MAHRALLVGLGGRGRAWAKVIEATEGWSLAGAVDPVPEARAAAALALDDDKLFEAIDHALDALHPDVVIVASDPDHHAEPALAAIERGAAVMIEKPLAPSLAIAKQIADAGAAAAVPVMVAQNYRYMRAHRTVRSLIGSGRLGEVRRVVAQYYKTPHEMAPSLAQSEHAALWGMAVHHLDAFRHALGAEAESVIAQAFTHEPERSPRRATLRALLEFERGIKVDYSATYESSGHEFFERGQEFYERVVGSDATLHVFQRWLFLCEGRKLPRPVRRGPRSVSEERALLDELARCLETGEEPQCSASDNLGTMAIVEACIRSDAERRWVSMEELAVV